MFFVLTASIIVLLNMGGKVRGVDGILVPLLMILSIVVTMFIIAHPKTKTKVICCLGPSLSGVDTGTFLTTLKRLFCSVSLTVNVVVACNSCVGGGRSVRDDIQGVRVFSAKVTFLTKLVVMPTIFIFSNKSRTSLGTKPALVFVALPGIFSDVTKKRLVKAMFFILMLFTTLASSVSLVRAIISVFISGAGGDHGFVAIYMAICAILVTVPSSLKFKV